MQHAMKIFSFIIIILISSTLVANEDDFINIIKINQDYNNNVDHKFIRGQNSFDLLKKNYYIFQLLKNNHDLL